MVIKNGVLIHLHANKVLDSGKKGDPMSKKDTSFQNGNVRKKGSKWYYRFRIREDDGSWKMHEFRGGETKRETEAMLKQALEDYNNEGRIISPGELTVNELGNLWYSDEVDHSVMSTNGKYDYENVLRHIREHPLGATRLCDVTIEQLQSYVDEKYYGEFDENGVQLKHAYSDSHMRKQFHVLESMFKYAVYPKRIMRENIMQYVKRRKKLKEVDLFEEVESPVETISPEEYELLENMLAHHESDSYLLLPVQIAYHTGMRAGEVCGLTWQDIDLKNLRLWVRRSMYYDKNTKCWELKVPKSKKFRVIDFGESLAEILRNARKKQLEEMMENGPFYQKHFFQVREIKGQQHYQIFTDLGSGVPQNASRSTKGRFVGQHSPDVELTPVQFVCTKPMGELMTTQTLKWCNKLVHRELPTLAHFHFHELRHTFASTLVLNGADIKDVQELMGHSDIRITLNTYTHSTSCSRKHAAAIFEKAIAK